MPRQAGAADAPSGHHRDHQHRFPVGFRTFLRTPRDSVKCLVRSAFHTRFCGFMLYNPAPVRQPLRCSCQTGFSTVGKADSPGGPFVGPLLPWYRLGFKFTSVGQFELEVCMSVSLVILVSQSGGSRQWSSGLTLEKR